MKKLLITICTLCIINTVSAQVADSFEIRSAQILDLDGNMYETVMYFDHIPTRQDTVNAMKQSDIEIKKAMAIVRAMKQRKVQIRRNRK